MPKELLAVIAGVLVTAASAVPALAHGEEQVGPRRIVLGWEREPAYVEQPNAVEVAVRDGQGRGVEGLAGALKVEVRTGDASTGPLALEPAFGSPGTYLAPLVPTAPGTYTFHVTGTIDGEAVDVEMTSGPDTFDSVRDAAAVQFPRKLPAAASQAERLERIDARIDDVRSQASRAAVVGWAALAVSVIVFAVALAGRRRS